MNLFKEVSFFKCFMKYPIEISFFLIITDIIDNKFILTII